MRKHAISKGKREVYLFIHRIMIVIVVICFVSIFCNSFISIHTISGTYHYVISIFDKKDIFEDSEAFYDILSDNMEDVTRMVVIQSQLETEGSYDGEKEISISAYANRMELIVDDSLTATYYLDDLITWGNYGYDVQTVYGTWDELNEYFADATEITTSSGTTASAAKEDALLNAEEEAAKIGLAAQDDDQYGMEILIDRYKTVDGKGLKDYASDITEYEELKKNLYITATSLFENYMEYMEYEKIYGDGNTNLQYCIQMVIDDEIVRFTNIEEITDNQSADEITTQMTNYDKYIYFNPDKLQITTNTSVSAINMKDILNTYEYAFGDDTRVWFGLDTNFVAQDDFYNGQDVFTKFMPYYWQTITIGLVALFLWIFMGVILTVYEGRVSIQNTEKPLLVDNKKLSRKDKLLAKKNAGYQFELSKVDYVPLELHLLGSIATIIIYVFVISWIYHYSEPFSFQISWLPILLGVLAFTADVIFSIFYLSIVRRVKAKKLWRYTLVYRMLTSGKEWLISTYNQGTLVSRFWIPYVIYLIVNLIMVLLGIGGIIGALLLDIIVGIYIYKEQAARKEIITTIENIKNGELKQHIDTRPLNGENLTLALAVNSISEGIRRAVDSSMKDEKMKTDLIANVSHDIKTPLTSIINYVDLIKRENVENENIKKYVDVLEVKAQRLKQLTDDLVEASKISSGNMELDLETINFVELIYQSLAEFEDKFQEKDLKLVTTVPDSPIYIEADSKGIWRVVENLFNNIWKYALEGTRVYVTIEEEIGLDKKEITFSVKNISSQPLSGSAQDLTERFIRGDVSRGTEGSGLGLSIAKSLTEAQGGIFEIVLDGDLFKIILTFGQKENY